MRNTNSLATKGLKTHIIFYGGWGGGVGGGRKPEQGLGGVFAILVSEKKKKKKERKRENSNSNSNSKTLFSKDCSLGSFRPV